MTHFRGLHLTEARNLLITGISRISNALGGQDLNPPFVAGHLTDSLTALRKIGFGDGPELGLLRSPTIHADVTGWIKKHGINPEPMGPIAGMTVGSMDAKTAGLIAGLLMTIYPLPHDGRQSSSETRR